MWCSPPCPDYSPAKTIAPRDLGTADEIVKAMTIRIHLLLRPKALVVENPTGLLRSRELMIQFLKFSKPSSYRKFKFSKDSDIFINIPCYPPHRRIDNCKCKRETTAQRGSSRNGTPGSSREDLHSVPCGLVQKLFLHEFEDGRSDPADYTPEGVLNHEMRVFVNRFSLIELIALLLS